jgi:TatD DNase family protein
MVQPAAAIDTHCHLFLMEGDPGQTVRAARSEGVERMICVGIDPESSRRSLELAESFAGVFATAGVHPHTASAFDPPAASVVEELLANPLVVGVGETGLDYYRLLSPVEDQHRAFRTHIALSRETGKPLVVHVRQAWDDALRILSEERADRVVLHCFTGDEVLAREASARGYYVSFAGNLTYPKTEAMRAAAAVVPEDRLVAETDSPFLTPQSKRGIANTPSNVLEVHAMLAEIRGVNVEAMVGSATEAALRAFPLFP